MNVNDKMISNGPAFTLGKNFEVLRTAAAVLLIPQKLAPLHVSGLLVSNEKVACYDALLF